MSPRRSPWCAIPAEGIKPEIITQGVHVVATYLDQAARLLNKELGVLNEMLNAERLPDAAKVGALAAGVMGRIDGVETYLFPPLVTIGSVKETEADEDGSGGGNGIFGYLLVMTTVMALLFTAIRSVSDIHDEHNSGMLRRQLATPLDIGLVIGAKTVFGVLLGVIVLTTLAVIGLIPGLDHSAGRSAGGRHPGGGLQPGRLRRDGRDHQLDPQRETGRHPVLAGHHGHERPGRQPDSGQPDARRHAGRGHLHHQLLGHRRLHPARGLGRRHRRHPAEPGRGCLPWA